MSEKHICELCNREVPFITEHHLIPKERGGKHYDTAKFCKMCHTQIHALYSNRELAARLFSIKRLQSDDGIKKYLNFIKKMPGDTIIPIKKSKNRIKSIVYFELVGLALVDGEYGDKEIDFLDKIAVSLDIRRDKKIAFANYFFNFKEIYDFSVVEAESKIELLKEEAEALL